MNKSTWCKMLHVLSHLTEHAQIKESTWCKIWLQYHLSVTQDLNPQAPFNYWEGWSNVGAMLEQCWSNDLNWDLFPIGLKQVKNVVVCSSTNNL